MKFELQPLSNRKISDEELFEDIRRVRDALGGIITRREYNEHGKFSSQAIGRAFGSWNKALKACGIEPSKVQFISDDELFQNLEEVWTQLGHQPSSNDLVKPISKISVDPYQRRFGTWRKALEKFVEVANGDPAESEPEVEVVEVVDSSNAIVQHKTKRDINWRMRWQVLNRDYFRCVSCGLSPAIAPGTILHVDHIKPWSKGGETVLENLQTLCATCNLGKSNIE